jgi:hypothetical protein
MVGPGLPVSDAAQVEPAPALRIAGELAELHSHFAQRRSCRLDLVGVHHRGDLQTGSGIGMKSGLPTILSGVSYGVDGIGA